jgi:hypothetical protein
MAEAEVTGKIADLPQLQAALATDEVRRSE